MRHSDLAPRSEHASVFALLGAFFFLMLLWALAWGGCLAGLFHWFGGIAWKDVVQPESQPQMLVMLYVGGLYLGLMLNLLYFQERSGLKWAEMGFKGPVLKGISRGFFIGTNLIFMQYTLLMGLDLLQRQLYHWPENILEIIALALPMALAFAWIEEWLFRGWIQSLLLLRMSRARGLGLMALIFAGVHFLKPWEGWETLIAFAGLFGAGYFLGLVRLFTGSLWPGIGLHAGWIFIISISSQLALFGQPQNHLWFSGGYNPASGGLGVAFLAGLTLIFGLIISPKTQSPTVLEPVPAPDGDRPTG